LQLQAVDPGDVRVDPRRLHALGVRALAAVGVSEEHARLSADVLLASELRGVESHGFAHLADFYVGRIRDGRVKPNPDVRVVQDTPATAVVDGDGGLGFIPGRIATRLAIEKAAATGIGMVSTRNSTHFGPGFFYAMEALPHDMLGISMTTGGNIVVPPGGVGRTYGSNVIAFAAPTRGAPYVLDMATSVVAGGKFEIAKRRGKTVPSFWGESSAGEPIVSNPEPYFERGAILPLGGTPEGGAWKGFGLALMSDILCGVLSGGGASTVLSSPGACHFVAAIRIDAFLPKEDFLDGMDAMIGKLKASPRKPGAPALTYAGELEAAKEADALAHGVPLHPSVVTALRVMCDEIGVPFDLV
jgi:LDH2 family malate/lactate/ureidoglycolate dehydrogenase